MIQAHTDPLFIAPTFFSAMKKEGGDKEGWKE